MRSLRHRVTAAAVTTALAASLWTGAAGAEEGPAPASPAAQLLDQLNGRRAAVGLAPLTLAPEATLVAQSWAQAMAANGRITHRTDLTAGMPRTWIKLGENVGSGPSPDDIHRAFVASPTHDANIVDPRFTSVGIGVTEVDGQLYVAEEFLTTAATAAARPTAARRPRVRSGRSGARRTVRRTARTTARRRSF
jgi:uncharacterized protein YkwD